MYSNVSKIKTIIVYRSGTMHLPSPALTVSIVGTVQKKFDELDILGVILYSKMTFAKHLR